VVGTMSTGPDAAPGLALCGGTVVVALDPPEVVETDLVVAGGRVVGMGPPPPGTPRRDCSGTIVLPGNTCAHHHLYSALARGMPYTLEAPANFLQILQRVWWRLDRALDGAAVRASALRGGLDALLAGTTTIVDHHASPNAIDGSLDVMADALGELGVRSVLCYEVSDRDGPERAASGIEENLRFLARPRPLARGMMGAHASFTLSDETLEACVAGAASHGAGIHIHACEDRVDNSDARARYGSSAIARLDRSGVLGEAALLAHCVHADAADTELVAGSGATVVCNPRSNMNNGVGHSPFNLRSGNVALGTDGIDGNMFAELQAGFFRTREADLGTPADWPLVRLARGAAVAGRCFGEPLLGTLRPGAPADLVVLDLPAPTPLGPGNLAGHLVFGLARGRVRDVMVAGDLVVADHRSTRVDEDELAAQSRREARKLWDRLEDLPAHEFVPEGGPS
jgi:putative selenium metabolism protein SsnA